MKEMKTLTFPNGETYEIVDAEARSDLENLIRIDETPEVEIPTMEDLNKKTEKVQIDYVGNNVFKLGDQTLNYQQLHDIHLVSPDFAFIQYGDRAYLLSYVQDDPAYMREMRFESVIATTDANLSFVKTSGIYVKSSDGINIVDVDLTDINSENKAYKATTIDDSHKNDVWYPSVKAVTDYVSTEVGSLKTDIDKLKEVAEGYLYREEVDTEEAYSKDIPDGALPYATLDKIGGNTIKFNQLCNINLHVNSSVSGVTFTKTEDGFGYILNGTATASTRLNFANPTSAGWCIIGHRYLCLVRSDKTLPSSGQYNMVFSQDGSHMFSVNNSIPRINIAYNQYGFRTSAGFTYDNVTIRPAVFDLTDILGEDVAETLTTVNAAKDALAALGIDADGGNYPYQKTNLRHADVVSVNTGIETKEIPSAIRNLPGYGETGSVVDFEHKTYTAPDGTQTDISDLLTDGFENIRVEAGGTITFEQTALALPVPNQETYLIKLLVGGETV